MLVIGAIIGNYFLYTPYRIETSRLRNRDEVERSTTEYDFELLLSRGRYDVGGTSTIYNRARRILKFLSTTSTSPPTPFYSIMSPAPR